MHNVSGLISPCYLTGSSQLYWCEELVAACVRLPEDTSAALHFLDTEWRVAQK